LPSSPDQLALFPSSALSFTCELFLAAVSHTGFQVLQLDLDLLVVSQRLLTLSPERGGRATETGAEGQVGIDNRGQVVPVHTGLVGIQ